MSDLPFRSDLSGVARARILEDDPPRPAQARPSNNTLTRRANITAHRLHVYKPASRVNFCSTCCRLTCRHASFE